MALSKGYNKPSKGIKLGFAGDQAMADMKPTVMLTAKELPAIKDYDVGDTYWALYECKMVSKSQDKNGQYCGTFEVLSVQEVPHDKVDAIKKEIGETSEDDNDGDN